MVSICLLTNTYVTGPRPPPNVPTEPSCFGIIGLLLFLAGYIVVPLKKAEPGNCPDLCSEHVGRVVF